MLYNSNIVDKILFFLEKSSEFQVNFQTLDASLIIMVILLSGAWVGEHVPTLGDSFFNFFSHVRDMRVNINIYYIYFYYVIIW